MRKRLPNPPAVGKPPKPPKSSVHVSLRQDVCDLIEVNRRGTFSGEIERLALIVYLVKGAAE